MTIFAGTAVYGDVSTDPLGDTMWSAAFSGGDFTQYLLASGDMSMWVQIGRDELASRCNANCANCGMTLLGSSTGGSSVGQYCRTGASEDPWISAGDHPTHIVYGENGHAGHTGDDALNFGGANVWISGLPQAAPSPPAVDVVEGFAHMTFQDSDWYLVRHRGNTAAWHPANDNLIGSAVYGDVGTDPVDDTTWSAVFGGSDFTQYLLASGDMSMWVTITRAELAGRCNSGCANCPMELTASSTGEGNVGQYCRPGASEDPWISAGDHPTHIVYGENGYAGHNGDDALNFGGANVWINAVPAALPPPPPPPAVDIVGGFAHMAFEGSDWYLARRVASTSTWHPATDNLVGTAAYGDQGTDPTQDATWSVPFGSSFTQYLLASGDLSMWVIMAKDELVDRCAAGCANCPMTLMGSHMGGEPVGQYCRPGAAEDPWISAGDHPTHIVYGENGYGGHNADDALNFGGANVWINDCPAGCSIGS